MFEKAKYNLCKTTKNTMVLHFEEKYSEDEYGSTITEQVPVWKPFESNLYYLEADNEHYICGKRVKLYYPIAPSGRYNERFANLYLENLDNMEVVGTYDGETFSVPIPYLYTSINELDVLDVFTLKEDYTEEGIWESDPTFTISKGTKLVLESYCTITAKHYESVTVSDLNTKKKYNLNGNLRVNLVGKIEMVPNYISYE